MHVGYGPKALSPKEHAIHSDFKPICKLAKLDKESVAHAVFLSSFELFNDGVVDGPHEKPNCSESRFCNRDRHFNYNFKCNLKICKLLSFRI